MTFVDFTCWVINYHVETRNGLFISGFTLGTFLFSMKSLIIKTLKDEIYDKTSYHIDVESLKEHQYDIAYYGSLERFSNLLFLAISLSFASAISQFTLGFLGHWITSSICLLLALTSWLVLGNALYQVKIKWNDVFKHAEIEAEQASAKRLKKKNKAEKIQTDNNMENTR